MPSETSLYCIVLLYYVPSRESFVTPRPLAFAQKNTRHNFKTNVRGMLTTMCT